MFNNFILTYKILDRDLKNSYQILIFLIFLSAIFEAVSIGLLLPFLTLLSTMDELNSRLPIWIFELLKDFDTQKLSYLFLIILTFIFLLKFFVVLITNYLKFNFTAKVQSRLSQNLLKKYLNLSIEFFNENNSNKLIRNLTSEIDGFSSILLAYQHLINEIIISVLIIIILFMFNQELTLIILFVGVIFSFLFLKITKSKIYEFGKTKQSKDYLRIRNLNEAFQGIKELKMYSAENFFSSLFGDNTIKRSQSLKWYRFFQQVPRISVEGIIIIGFLFFYFYFITLENNLNQFVITGSIYAICTMRLAPSITKILINFQQVKYSTPIVNNIINQNELSHFKNNIDKIKDSKILREIRLEKVDISLNDKIILDKIDLKIELGKFYGISGPSGSGKSTLINLLCGLIKPSRGQLFIDGNKFDTLENFKSNFGYVPQNVFLIQGSIKENIIFGDDIQNVDENKLDLSLELSGLKNYIDGLSDNINTITGERGQKVSGGQMQRIAIARAIYRDTPIIILDEFTSALDDKLTETLIENLLKIKKNKTIILSTHNMKNLEICDHVIKINKGKIII